MRFPRLAGFSFILLLLLTLEVVVAAGLVDRVLIPPPTRIGGRLWEIIVSGTFIGPLAQTLYVLVLGYAAACFLGITAGLMMGRWRPIHHLLEPLIECLRPLPKAALLPPLMLFLGFGTSMKVTIVALAAFFPVVINTIQGAVGVNRTLVDAGRTFGHSPARILAYVVLIAALPMIFAGMRVALGFGLIVAVLSEMLSGSGGIGSIIIDMQRTFRVVDMYAWLFILLVLGYLLNATIAAVERWSVPWN